QIEGLKAVTNVRFGSQADICSAKRYVRSYPESGHLQRKSRCPLWPKADISSDGPKVRARLLRYAIRLLGARMTQAWPTGTRALRLIVATSGAFVQTGLAVSRHRDGGCGIGVALGGSSLRFR